MKLPEKIPADSKDLRESQKIESIYQNPEQFERTWTNTKESIQISRRSYRLKQNPTKFGKIQEIRKDLNESERKWKNRGKSKHSEKFKKIRENSRESGQILKNMIEPEKLPAASKESESIPESLVWEENLMESEWI